MPSAATIDAVTDALTHINAAWRDGRPDAMAPLLDEDVAMVFPGFAGRINGRKALVDSFVAFGREATVHTFEHETLRPRWLSARGPDTILGAQVEVQVIFDDARLGGPSTLRGIAVSDVAYFQFVDPVAAAGRWGGEHANGVIFLSTRAQGRP